MFVSILAAILFIEPIPAPPRVLVLDLQAEGVDSPLAREATEAVAATLGRSGRLRVLAKEDLRRLLSVERTRQMLDCQSDTSCLSKLTDPAKADLLVVGSIGRIGESFLLNLSLVDAQISTPVARSGTTFFDASKIGNAARDAARDLFGWSDIEDRARFSLPDGRKSSFVVLDFSTEGLNSEVGRNLTQVLTNEIRQAEGAEVLNRDDVVALVGVEKMRQILQSDCDTTCLVKIGDALDTDYVVLGQIGRITNTFLVALTLVDRTELNVGGSHRVSESFMGLESELIRAVRHAARKLLGIAVASPGSIQVGSPIPGARVFVDNQEVGSLPLPPISSVGPGRYAVRLSRSGYLDWQSDIYVSPGETSAVWADLVASPRAWYEEWWVWAAFGMVVAGGTTAAVLATQSGSDFGGGTALFPRD